MKHLKLIIPILAALAILGVGAFIALPTFAHGASKPVVTCRYELATQPPCHNTQTVPFVVGPTHWTQQIWVNPEWSFTYICKGVTSHDYFAVEYKEGGVFVPYIEFGHLTCDNRIHVQPEHFVYGHIIVLGFSRAIKGFVTR